MCRNLTDAKRIRHEEDLLLRYLFTAEIIAALVSYLFPASFFQFKSQRGLEGRGQSLMSMEEETTIVL